MKSSRTHWNREENLIVVEVYFEMLRKEQLGEPYIKTQYNKIVREKTGRSKGAVEFKFCNISFLLQEIGQPIIGGYKPRSNAQRGSLSDVLSEYLDMTNDLSSLCIRERVELLLHGVPRIDFANAAVFTLQQAFPIDGWHIDTLINRFDERFPRFSMAYPARLRRTLLIETLRLDERVSETTTLVFRPFSRFKRTQESEEEARLIMRYGYESDDEPRFQGMNVGITANYSKPVIPAMDGGGIEESIEIIKINANQRLQLKSKASTGLFSGVQRIFKSLFRKNLSDC